MAILSCHVSIKLPPKISDGQKILLRAIVRHGPKTVDLPSVWLDTCGSLPYQPDALARVAASPSQGLAGSKAWRGQRLGGVKPCSGLRKAGRRPRTGFAGPFKGAGPLFGHRDLESRSPGRRSSGRAVSSLFEDALGHADVLSQSLFQKPYFGICLRGRLYRNRSRYFSPVSRRSIN